MPDSGMPTTFAIVGMGCRFPGGVDSPQDFWRFLVDGGDAVTEIPRDRFDLDALFDSDPAVPGKIYTRWGGFVERIDEFDAGFFGIAPREARRIDPQQRLLLEVAWEALEDGGQAPDSLAGTNAGVFVGISGHDYSDIQALTQNRQSIDAHLNSGAAASIAANRISYVLDFRGPSLAVDTACSSSLTAVHLACRSLMAGECDLAIAGGVGVILSPEVTMGFCKASMLSPDGRCRAFDARANGYVRSEGAGAVVLKPLENALSDRDPIHAVILGSAINQDGRTTGISVPRVAAQEEMIRRALRNADVDPQNVCYVEAHGTGTIVGDPMEAEAVGKVFSAGRDLNDRCLIGSVKTNLGHLEAASGIAGLIKTALVVKHGRIPANLHFSEPNPAIPFDELRLRVPTALEPWPAPAPRTIAGVNSFGFGGANAHVVLDAPPRIADSRPPGNDGLGEDRLPHILPLSARDPQALREMARLHSRHIADNPPVSLHDWCYTAAVRRSHHADRMTVVGTTREELIEHLEAFAAGERCGEIATGKVRTGDQAKLVFVFTGMGPQWWGMGRNLFGEEPVFRRKVEEVAGILDSLSGWSLIDELFADESNSRVKEAWLAHPANFAIQLAAAELWRSWGIVPDAVVGHSSGEMAAACVAGALSLPEAARLAFHRGRLQHLAAGTGRMLAAAITAEEAEAIIAGNEGMISIAAINAPRSVALAGAADVLERIEATLSGQDRFVRFLPVDVPYHAPQMEPLRDEFFDAVADLACDQPRIPLILEVTGDWADGQQLDATYWWRNIRRPVRFADAVQRLAADGYEHFVEVGPHPVLASAIAETMVDLGRNPAVFPTMRRDEDDRRVMLRTLGALHVQGRPVDWSGVYPEGRCVTLPAYPWQRERHWFDEDEAPASAPRRSAGVDTGHPLLGHRLSSPRSTWETDLNDPRTGYLDAHIVQDSTVFPGAAYVEMLLAAAKELQGEEPVSVENIEFRKLLFLRKPRGSVVQLLYNDHNDSVEIFSAPAGSADSWTVHTTGRISRSFDDEPREHLDLDELRERCATRLSVEEHYAEFERRAYRFGPEFHTVQEVWLGSNDGLARAGFLPEVELPVDAYQVHPALLDAALQLMAAIRIRSQASPGEDTPFFPVSIRRLVHRRNPGRRFWVYARARHEDDPARRSGDDAWIIDETGNVCVTLEELQFKVLDKDGPPQQPEVDDWLYELDWEEAALASRPTSGPSPLRSTADVVAAVEKPGGSPDQTREVACYLDIAEPTLNRVAAGFASAALEPLQSRAAGDADHAVGVAQRCRRLYGELTQMTRLAGAVPHDPETLHRELDDLVAAYPAFAAEVELFRRGGARLAEILRGDLDAREVLLDARSLELLSQLYRLSPASRGFHTLLADAVEAAVGPSADGRPVRVLEVGAGTGAATDAVLPRLPAATEYVFTDISPFFVAQAREHYQDRPGMQFSVLDIEKDPREQEYEPHSFDLVVAVNVLHTTAELRTSLGNIRELLAPGGMVLLQELTRRSPWFNLVFGLLDGWWRFADSDLRTSSPLLCPGQWRALFETCGFEGAATLYQEAGEDEHVQTVILGQAPHEAAGRHWLVFADETSAGEQLAAVMERQGDQTTLVYPGLEYQRRNDGRFELPPGDRASVSALLEDIPDTQPLHGIVHFWSLDAPHGGETDTATLMDSQMYGCGSVLALIQALEASNGSAPEVWLVTAGAQAVEGFDSVPNVSQAALWGLGRVAVSEQARIRCRMVDIGPSPAPEEIEALATEVAGEGEDEEVALRGGTRFVRRLRRVSLESRERRGAVRMLSPEHDSFRLEIGLPGSFETLQLCETPIREPGPGEVLVRVVAAGLNFPDVLKALGMLPPTAFQHNPDPHGLGMECAGVVLACGTGVYEFSPGDEVITLAGSVHASRTIAPTDLTVAKPPQISFEDAASILNAFVTARYALQEVGRIEPGERVLIHSASGAVGLASIQHCRRIGAEIFATAGTPEKREHLRSLGVSVVMDSRSLTWADEILERTGGEGVDVILNSLAGEAIPKGVSVLRPFGRFIEIGKRDIIQNAQVGLEPFRRNLSFHAVDLIQLGLERPRKTKRMIRQIVQEVADGSLSLVPVTRFDLADAEQAFRLMAQAKHIGKVVLTAQAERYAVKTREEAPLFRQDATYLITGGLGGFGLAVAEWMVREGGASTIVLMSRSGVPKDNATALDALQASPARVILEVGDVSREEDVKRILGRIDRELPPLKGIFHAAMVLDDDELVALDQRRFRAVLEPKIAGAWNLHRLTGEMPLDYFVLFSSVATMVGHPTQGNYSAANAFLDALAAHRHGLGLPALAVGWGVISGVGYVSRHTEIAQFLDRAGLVPSTPEEALETLGRLLRYDLAHVIAARIEWQKWAQLNVLSAAARRFQRFLGPGHTEEEPATRAETPLSRLRRTDPEERPSVMEEYLVEKVAKVMGTAAGKVQTDRLLTELGFDSLMAVELATGLNSDLEVKLKVVKILEGMDIRKLATTLLDQVNIGASGAESAAPPAAAQEGTMRELTEEPIDSAEAPRYPVSFEQRRFWYLHQLEAGNPAYHLFAAARLTGELDPGVLQRCIDELVRRHEALRTRFIAVDGEPMQVIAPSTPAPLTLHDVSHLSPNEHDAAIQRITTSEIRILFDLEQPPLLRGALVRISDVEHVFVLIAHHIAVEAHAMTVLVREIMALYGDFSEGRPSPLPEPAARYADYVRRQESLLATDAAGTQLDYWVRQLDGASSQLPIRTDHPRPAVSGLQGRRHHFTLSRGLSDSLRELARREGATVFMTLLSAYLALLHRYSGETDISVGTPVSTRTDAGIADVVGCCMNTLVLRSDLSGNPTFRELLRRVQDTTLGAFAHQDVPFDRVVEKLQPHRDTGRSPLFRTMFILHNTRFPELRMEGLRVQPYEVESEAAVTDLTLLVETGDQLHGALEYDAELFETSTIELLYAHFLTMIEGIVDDPERRLSALPVVSTDERRRITVEWNDTREAFDKEVCLHELFEEQVQRTPTATAVVWGDELLTYRELNEQANRLARYLGNLGIAPESVVGVCLERSVEALIAAIAVLKAGGVYLPLDPEHPEERLRFMLEDAAALVLLTGNGTIRTDSAISARIVDLDDEWETISDQRADNMTSGVRPENAAYVIYTSGSTGQPKGVVIEHRAICNQVQWRRSAFSLSPADAVLLHTRTTFDPAVWEIYGPLAAGARVIVAPPGVERDGALLVETISANDVTVLQIVPSVLEALLDEPGIERCRSLKHILCGGETLTPELRERIFAHLAAELHNLYGPTEAAIDATSWTCRRGEERPVVPIGRPIANAKIYILDDRLNLTPVGVPGELYIGGAGVGRGYVNRPDLTAERFIPDTFGDGSSALLYCSGDRARWLPDGSLEFLGRLDEQVKIRGFRVEPGEIESVLARHPTVRQAAVVACGEALEDRRLVAFVAAGEERVPDDDELSGFLCESLPRHMLPSAFVALDDLPRTPNGKVDRRALAVQDPPLPEREEPSVAPRDAVELHLVRIWESLLPEQTIGVTDDFFELGGHSLLAMRLAARIREVFDTKLPVSTLVQSRTIEQLARLLREPPVARSPLVAIQRAGSLRPFFCVHPAGGNVFRYVELARWLGEVRPFYGLEARGLDGEEQPHTRIEDMAAYYLEAVRAVQPEGPYLLGGWSMGGVIAFEMARQVETQSRHVALPVLLDAGAAITSLRVPEQQQDQQYLLRAFVVSLGLSPDQFTISMQRLQEMGTDEQLACVLEQARNANLLPPEMDVTGLHRQLSVFTANLGAMQNYVPQPFGGRITLLEAAESLGTASGDSFLVWEELAGQGVTRATVPGNHYTMLREPCVRHLARKLAGCLEAAETTVL